MLRVSLRKAPGLIVLASVLALIPLLLIMACGGDSGDEFATSTPRPGREETSERESEREDSRSGSAFSRPSTATPEDSDEDSGRRSIIPRGPTATPPPATIAPGPAPTVAAAPTTALIPVCPQRQPDPAAMLAPSSTSAETDKEALLALFEATGGEQWDSSGTWAGLAPIGEWQGVGVDGGTPAGQRFQPTREQITPEVLEAAREYAEREFG